MATTKNRLNITLSKDIEEALKASAKAADVPRSTRATELLKLALEIEEDHLLYDLVEERDTKDAKYISHDKMWDKIRANRN